MFFKKTNIKREKKLLFQTITLLLSFIIDQEQLFSFSFKLSFSFYGYFKKMTCVFHTKKMFTSSHGVSAGCR